MRAPCGTSAGYYQHRRHHQPPCPACCAAAAARRRRERATRADRPAQPLLYRLALAGAEPAEALTTADRCRLVTALLAQGWPLQRIAGHCRMTSYTTARIASAVPAHPAHQESA